MRTTNPAKWKRRRAAVVAVLALQYLCALAGAAPADTTATESVLPSTTSSLVAEPKFFPVSSKDRSTTMMLASVIEGETSATQDIVTTGAAISDKGTTMALPTETVTTMPESRRVDNIPRLPVKVDNSSTAAQAQQLLKFERQNQIGEAFLLACEMVRENPDSEFAYDAAIRTSLVLGLEDDTENFYRSAIKNSALPGKYFVQLAHFYSRRNKVDKLRRLLSDYEKGGKEDPDYWLTLARLAQVANETSATRLIAERAVASGTTLFPLVIIQSRAYSRLGEPEKARELILAAGDQNFGPLENAALLNEFIKLPGITPDEMAKMIRAALVNETSYRKARTAANAIIEQAVAKRLFHPLKELLMARTKNGEAADIEVWLAALMARREGNNDAALDLLTSGSESATPIIAYERAQALAEAGRPAEALPILSVLLAEQPTEVGLRILMAEQQLATGDAEGALQTLSAMPRTRLTSAERLRLCELSLTAATGVGDAARVADKWTELAQTATFTDLQAMGDVVLKSLTNPALRDEITSVVSERVKDDDQWPLLLLKARLFAVARDHKAELLAYSQYLDRDWNNVQMLRFVAELATQYANLPIKFETGGEGKDSPQLTLRATDSSDTDLATELYRRLIQIQPKVADNYSALMRIYQMRGEVETAKKVALELAESRKDSAETQAMAATIMDENGFSAESLPFFRSSLRKNPEDFSVWVKYAAALVAAKRYDDAQAIYQKILEEGWHGKPFNQPLMLSSLLKIATETKRTKDLIAYLGGLRSKEIPGKPEFLLSVSKLFIQLRSDDAAAQVLNDFVKQFPDHKLLPDAYLLLGQLAYTRQEYDEAINWFKRVVERFPGTPAAITAVYNIGEVKRQTGQPREAINTWLDLKYHFPNDDRAISGVYEAAKVAYNDLKDFEYAAKLLKQFIDSGSQDFTLLDKARKSLKKLEAGQPPFEDAK
ncbi:MAG: tetratricopeptide repeat protein [Candidatus Sumerlaeaceae bacterium]|nr:tetratricopeptide repeat protein [Candidatus Sumerlaeaceae bacterium]